MKKESIFIIWRFHANCLGSTEPGGYIQWEDVDPSVPALEGEECKKAHKNILDMFYSLGFEFE